MLRYFINAIIHVTYLDQTCSLGLNPGPSFCALQFRPPFFLFWQDLEPRDNLSLYSHSVWGNPLSQNIYLMRDCVVLNSTREYTKTYTKFHQCKDSNLKHERIGF